MATAKNQPNEPKLTGTFIFTKTFRFADVLTTPLKSGLMLLSQSVLQINVHDDIITKIHFLGAVPQESVDHFWS